MVIFQAFRSLRPANSNAEVKANAWSPNPNPNPPCGALIPLFIALASFVFIWELFSQFLRASVSLSSGS